MDELLKQRLAENGADVDGTIKRFSGDDKLYLHFIMKFKDDSNFERLEKGLEQEDLEEVYKAAHTLKGVSANLGLTPVYEASSALTEFIRNKNISEIDRDQLTQKVSALDKARQSFIGLLDGQR